MDVLNILYIVTGVLALIIALGVFILKDKKSIRLAKLSDDFCWTVNYFCKGSTAQTGVAQNVISVFRDLIFYYRARGSKWADSAAWCIIFVVFYMSMPIYTWAGWYSLLPAVGSSISTVGLYLKNTQVTRWLTLPAQFLCLIYALIVENYFAMFGNLFLFLSAFIGLLLEARRRRLAVRSAAK